MSDGLGLGSGLFLGARGEDEVLLDGLRAPVPAQCIGVGKKRGVAWRGWYKSAKLSMLLLVAQADEEARLVRVSLPRVGAAVRPFALCVGSNGLLE